MCHSLSVIVPMYDGHLSPMSHWPSPSCLGANGKWISCVWRTINRINTGHSGHCQGDRMGINNGDLGHFEQGEKHLLFGKLWLYSRNGEVTLEPWWDSDREPGTIEARESEMAPPGYLFCRANRVSRISELSSVSELIWNGDCQSSLHFLHPHLNRRIE